MERPPRIRIAVLLTCFNRKDKTEKCLASLHAQQGVDHIDFQFFLVDDGSSDGTSGMVSANFPDVKIIRGDGSLFWAGGMRLAWKSAIDEGAFDYFWLVNDDTVVYPDTLKHLLSVDEQARKTYGKGGLYVSSTLDMVTGTCSYGGRRLISEKDYKMVEIEPTNGVQSCDLCNANILLVSNDVVLEVGILSDAYTHALADYDYSLRAKRSGFPLLMGPNYGGECTDDHKQHGRFSEKNLRARINYLYSPKGFAFREFLHYTKTFFPGVYFRTWLTFWMKTLFPKAWNRIKRD